MSGLPQDRLWRLCWSPLVAVSHAMGPRWPGMPSDLAEESAKRLAVQLSLFPPLQRFGFQLGLLFLEWGAPLGAWGVRPLSQLSPEAAERRLQRMLHSRFPPVRLLLTGCKILISLHSYSDPRVEAALGFRRTEWRRTRLELRNELLKASTSESPPLPNALTDVLPEAPPEEHYLDWDAAQLVAEAARLNEKNTVTSLSLSAGSSRVEGESL